MRFLLAGEWCSDLHEEPAAEALVRLGHEVVRFPWARRFGADGDGFWRWPSRVSGKVQNKYLVGPRLRRLNEDLIETARRERPDALFIYRGTHIFLETLDAVRSVCPGVVIVGYCNDDPFSPTQRKSLWRHFLKALPAYDLMLAYREGNLADFRAAGAKAVRLMRSWFIPWVHKPIESDQGDHERFDCDVAFIGHHEDDGRVGCLEALQADGVRLRLFGPYDGFGGFGWRAALSRSPSLSHLRPTRLVWGEEYAKALNGAKIALCFLSKMNRDTYTRRCFEIPAAGALLMSERTDDLRSLFREGREAEFFADAGELRRKVRDYLADESLRREVAAAGRARVIADGHDVVSRMRDMVSYVLEIEKERAVARPAPQGARRPDVL